MLLKNNSHTDWIELNVSLQLHKYAIQHMSVY
jgi:hypothetical protein